MEGSSDVTTVTLHQFKRNEDIPNLSPACLKLETYLRMTKIPYTIDSRLQMSSKGKVPWIEYQGKSIPDSNFIIKFLNEEFSVDLNKDLTEAEKAISLGLRRMLEENTYWTFAYYRWFDDYDTTKRRLPLSTWSLINGIFARKALSDVKTELYGHGIGRHSSAEIYEIARDDLRALSDYLGDKDFMMGDKPTLLDASVFGYVGNVLWADPHSPQHHFIKENLGNLEVLCRRIKEEFWPDWNEILKSEEKK